MKEIALLILTRFLATNNYTRHGGYCFHLCLSVCLIVFIRITVTTDQNFNKLYAMVGRNPGTNH